MNIRIAILLALTLAPAAAVAQDQAPVACHPDQAEQIADAPVDLGDGMVYQNIYPGTGGVRDGVVNFVDCASGMRIVAAMPLLTDGTQRTLAEVVEIMTAAMRSDVVFSAQDVIDAMTQAGAPAELRTSPREACACALYYPDLRGDKEPWVAP